MNLTSEGAGDWAHWGLSTPSSFDHNANVTSQISNYSVVGTGTVRRHGNNLHVYSWTNGVPTAQATNTATGVFIKGLNTGFQMTVPADLTPRILNVYVGLWATQGRLEASLSDGSAPPYIDTSLMNPSAASNRVYTLSYKAGTSGQTLTVKWTSASSTGNVTLQAASLN
jgi:hypothetical protein